MVGYSEPPDLVALCKSLVIIPLVEPSIPSFKLLLRELIVNEL